MISIIINNLNQDQNQKINIMIKDIRWIKRRSDPVQETDIIITIINLINQSRERGEKERNHNNIHDIEKKIIENRSMIFFIVNRDQNQKIIKNAKTKTKTKTPVKRN